MSFYKWPLLQFLSDSYESTTHDVSANGKKMESIFHMHSISVCTEGSKIC